MPGESGKDKSLRFSFLTNAQYRLQLNSARTIAGGAN